MSFKNHFIGASAVFRKEMIRLLRVWRQTILAPLVTTTLYFIIFGQFIGSQISDIAGFTYMQFIVPGIVMMPVVTGSFGSVVFSVYFARFANTMHDVTVSSLPNRWFLAGTLAGGVVRGMLVGSFVLLISLFFSPLQVHNLLFLIGFMFLTSLVFSLAGFIMGLYSRDFDDTMLVPTFILTPLIYLGGVFYSIKSLPEFWQAVSQFNPLLYMINGFRFGALGVTDVSLGLSWGVLIALAVGLFLFTTHLLKKGVGIKN